jgi:hypothetical protein
VYGPAFAAPGPYYYPVPAYEAPCPEEEDEGNAYYPAPPVYVPVPPPASVSFGFYWH